MVNGSSEERGFTALLEQVRSEVRLIAEGLITLDRKVDRGFQDVRQEMATGFTDTRTAITQLSTQLNSHTHGQADTH